MESFNFVADFYLKHYLPFCNKNKIEKNEFSPETVGSIRAMSDSNKSAIEMLDFLLFVKQRMGKLIDEEKSKERTSS